jgi:BirA family biotin operon repressor/biotin-[acetyl-CoA-carboxylase] ligase
MGNQWRTEPGMNLTFSIILNPSFVAPKDQFLLTCAVSLGLYDMLQTTLGAQIFIKWPNDLLVKNKKVAGILIENQLKGNTIRHSIIGIGLNVNQKKFNIKTATSMNQVSDQQFDLSIVLEELLHHVEARYMMLRNGKHVELIADYHNAMYWRNEMHTFSSASENFYGQINGVDHQGRLVIDCDGTKRCFNNKQVVYVK